MNKNYRMERGNQNRYNNNIKKALIIGTTVMTMYGIGLNKRTQELSQAIDPLRQEFTETVSSKEKRDFTFNYNGKLKEIAEAKNEFARNNNAIARDWKAYITTLDNCNVTKTKTPLQLNPFYWGREIEDSAIKNTQYTITKTQ